MKIIHLRFKNINSLAGENEIDFTQAAFTQDGLFAITGKTGAGKSSILDAISLAFYGKTPRVEITGSENAVITRGEKDCYAEIVFEVAGKIWKSAWKQERTRTGTLKPVNRVIADAAGVIVADQVRSCDQKIVEIIGLSFEQFTKVILLAQGSFAAFLQAKPNEKGELLEQITGTEIYAEISKKVFDRTKVEKEKLDKIQFELESLKLLSEEEVNSHTQEIVHLDSQKKQVDLTLLKLADAKKHLEDMNQLQAQLVVLKQQMPDLESQYQVSSVAFEVAEKAYQGAKEWQITQEPLFKKVRELDTKISEKEKLLQPLTSAISDIQIHIATIQKSIADEQASIEQSTILLAEKQSWANQRRVYETLLSQYAALEVEHGNIQKNLGELQALQTKNKGLQKQVEVKKIASENALTNYNKVAESLALKSKEIESKKAEIKVLLKGEELHTLQAKKEKVLNIGYALKALQEAETTIDKSEQALQEWKEKLQNYENENTILTQQIQVYTQAIKNLEVQMNLLDENIKLSKTIQSLEDHRHKLKDGDACPLCGSLEHPYALGNVPQLGEKEKELLTLKEKFKADTIACQHAEHQRAKMGSDRDNAKQNIANEELVLQENTGKREKIYHELKQMYPSFIAPDGVNRQAELEALLVEKRKENAELTEIIKKVTNYELQLKQWQDIDLTHLKAETEKANSQKNEAEMALKLIEQEWNDSYARALMLIEKCNNEQAVFSQKILQYGVQHFDDLRLCLDSWVNNSKIIENLKVSIADLQGKITQQTHACEVQKKLLKDKQIAQESIASEWQKIWIERKDIFGEGAVEEAEHNMKKQVVQGEIEKQHAEKKKHTLFTELEKNKALITEKEAALNKLQAKHSIDKSLDTLHAEWEIVKGESEAISQKMGAIKQTLLLNEGHIKNSKQQIKEKEQQLEIYRKWASLNELIGSSDGKKYRNFAQALTFEHLIGLANKQLQRMSDRYLLYRSGDGSNPFELSVIDKYQNSEIRTAQNLSGGEKFIVSLSLALGLANMASKNMRIDTMFIDEGFGTLDSDYLDVALNALSNLQSEGKIIGVISHLSELKERIATHIEVLPSGNGYSKIQITTGA